MFGGLQARFVAILIAFGAFVAFSFPLEQPGLVIDHRAAVQPSASSSENKTADAAGQETHTGP